MLRIVVQVVPGANPSQVGLAAPDPRLIRALAPRAPAPGGGPRRVLDDGRFRQIGERCYRTTTATGMGAGLVEVTVDNRRFRCLRALDLPTTDGSNEIGQSLIDLDTGRTVAYWQYRPTGWDADAADWLGRHSGVEIVVDDITYQRRNCTGRDEVALTHLALGLV